MPAPNMCSDQVGQIDACLAASDLGVATRTRWRVTAVAMGGSVAAATA